MRDYNLKNSQVEKLKKTYLQGSLESYRLINDIKLIVRYIENIQKRDFPFKINLTALNNTLLRLLDNVYIKSNHYIHYDDIESIILHNPSLNIDKLSFEVSNWTAKIFHLHDVIKDLGTYLFTSITYPELSINDSVAPPQSDEEILKKRMSEINTLEILLGKTKIVSYPKTVLIDLNNTCNFRCKTCMAQFGERMIPSYFLSFENIQEAFPYTKRISLAGTGEPLLTPYLECITQTIKKCGAPNVEVITNGSLIDKRLHAFEHIDTILISFDGADKRTFESLRAGSRYKKIIRNITLLRTTYPEKPIIFNTVVSRLNLDELVDIVKIGLQLGVNAIILNPIMIIYEHLKPLQLKSSDYNLFQEQITTIHNVITPNTFTFHNCINKIHFAEIGDTPRNKEYLYNLLETIQNPRRHPIRDLGEIEKDLMAVEYLEYYPESIENLISNEIAGNSSKETQKHTNVESYENVYDALLSELKTVLSKSKKIPIPYCTAPWTFIFVHSNGIVRACCNLYIPGSVLDMKFSEMWNSPVYVKLREAMLHKTPLPEMCKTCPDPVRYFQFNEIGEYAKSLGVELEGIF